MSRVKYLVIFSLVAILAVVNYAVWEKEAILSSGKAIYLKLAPRDPRSIMQGDYMALRFAISRDIYKQIKEKNWRDGIAVVELDNNSVAEFKRLYLQERLADREYLLKYKVGRRGVKLSTDAYFFKEGSSKKYEVAKYGIFRVDDKGNAILTSLADENLKTIGK